MHVVIYRRLGIHTTRYTWPLCDVIHKTGSINITYRKAARGCPSHGLIARGIYA